MTPDDSRTVQPMPSNTNQGAHIVKHLLLVAAVLALPVSVAAQALPTQSLAWDYSTAEIASSLVDRFEVNYDDSGYLDAGVVPVTGTPDAYRHPLPTLLTGQHSVVVRACNPNGCADPSDPPFVFDLVAGVPDPVDGGTLRIVN